jgi:hypothetical protein
MGCRATNSDRISKEFVLVAPADKRNPANRDDLCWQHVRIHPDCRTIKCSLETRHLDAQGKTAKADGVRRRGTVGKAMCPASLQNRDDHLTAAARSVSSMSCVFVPPRGSRPAHSGLVVGHIAPFDPHQCVNLIENGMFDKSTSFEEALRNGQNALDDLSQIVQTLTENHQRFSEHLRDVGLVPRRQTVSTT